MTEQTRHSTPPSNIFTFITSPPLLLQFQDTIVNCKISASAPCCLPVSEAASLEEQVTAGHSTHLARLLQPCEKEKKTEKGGKEDYREACHVWEIKGSNDTY